MTGRLIESVNLIYLLEVATIYICLEFRRRLCVQYHIELRGHIYMVSSPRLFEQTNLLSLLMLVYRDKINMWNCKNREIIFFGCITITE